MVLNKPELESAVSATEPDYTVAEQPQEMAAHESAPVDVKNAIISTGDQVQRTNKPPDTATLWEALRTTLGDAPREDT